VRRRRYIKPLQGRYEPIPSSSDRLNESRILGRIAQRLTEFGYRCVEAVLKIDVSATRPKMFAELVACDHFASVIEHQDENPKGLLLKFDAKAELPQLAGSPIHLERAEANPRPGWARNIHVMPAYHSGHCEGQISADDPSAQLPQYQQLTR
jgi:hypothetical protein